MKHFSAFRNPSIATKLDSKKILVWLLHENSFRNLVYLDQGPTRISIVLEIQKCHLNVKNHKRVGMLGLGRFLPNILLIRLIWATLNFVIKIDGLTSFVLCSPNLRCKGQTILINFGQFMRHFSQSTFNGNH
jgi:hypothetical protein